MPVDVRVNDVTTNVTVTDASAMLNPQVLERIVQAVIARLAAKQRDERQAEQERSLGASRNQQRP